MKGFPRWLVTSVAVLACSVAGSGGGPRANLATETPLPSPAPATLTPAPPTAVPPTPTPQPPVITADTVGGLALALSFGEGIVRSVAISPDGKVIAAAEGDPAASVGTIRLYEAASGEPRGALEGHESGVWQLAFSPDGRYLASAGRDHTARIWDWAGATLVKTLDFPNEVAAVAFSPDSRTLAVGGVDEPPGTPLQDAAIWTFAVDTWQPELKLAEYWNIPDIAFSPDGSLIVGGGTSRNARVWRAGDGAEQFILYHAGQVGGIAISPDGATVATALCEASVGGQCARGAIWLWSLSSGRLLETISEFASGVRDVAYSVDGSVLFAAAGDGTLRAYSTSDLSPLLAAPVPHGPYQQPITVVTASVDGRFLVTSGSGRIDVWRVGG